MMILAKCLLVSDKKVSKGAKIRNRYNQVPHLTQDTKKTFHVFPTEAMIGLSKLA